MAGLQICGKQSQTPYYIKTLNKNVYSLEEISYFIYNYINQVYRDFFCEELFSYIENELECTEIADHMRQMQEGGASTKDFIYFLLKVSRYYDSREIREKEILIDNIDSMSNDERRKIEADKLCREKTYNSAINIYNEILANKDNGEMSDHFYAEIAYSIGTIYAKLYMSKAANNYFEQAYKIVPDPKYSKAHAYISLINEDDDELLESIVKFRITDEQLQTMRAAVRAARNEIENSEKTKKLVEKFDSPSECESVIDNWKQEYYNMQS